MLRTKELEKVFLYAYSGMQRLYRKLSPFVPQTTPRPADTSRTVFYSDAIIYFRFENTVIPR